jgi:hypothetical protein
MQPPSPIPLLRLIHFATLPTLLARGALHAPNSTPQDGLPYRTIHNEDVQKNRRATAIRVGLGGTCHDYVPFYFGPLSVMLLNLKTGRVAGYNEGQAPLIYLTTTVERLRKGGCSCVFSDGHGLARFTNWYEDAERLDLVDWKLVGERYWADRPEDNDRQRRKQAEFLVWQSVNWNLIDGIGVLNTRVKAEVEAMLADHPERHQPKVDTRPGWYY